MSESKKYTLFISYRRSDSPDSVKLIYERLKALLPRWDIFYDHQSIPLGEAFPERLHDEVTSADVVLVIVGPRWLDILQQRKDQPTLDHVREEVRLAIESGRTVIPVFVLSAPVFLADDLNEFSDLTALPAFNSHRIRPDPDFENDLLALVAGLDRMGPTEGPGSVLGGKYRLVRELGAGGMGIVWLAEQLQPRRTVAVKLVKPGMDSREVLARFEAERQAVAVMDHPNIAKVFDAGKTVSGRPFFAMEYVHGSSITDYCDSKRLSPNERLRLFQQVCEAVQHAHQKGILHRDIKPGNVLVEEKDGKPVPKVIDFGLAKALSQNLTDFSIHTAFATRVGTLEYSSPEQAAGGAIDLDTRTDIYSLGALLYELLAGEPPFTRNELLQAGEAEMHRVIKEQDPQRPSVKLSSSNSLPAVAVQRQLEPKKLTAVLRRDLDWIVMKALEKDRTRRYASASGLSEEIHRYLVGDPIQARPPSTAYRVRKVIRKHPGVVASIAIITATLLLGIASSSWFGYQANVAKNVAIAQRDVTESTLARSSHLLANARWNENRVADSIELLDRIPSKFRNVEWYFDRRMFEGSDITLYGHRDSVQCVAFSADGLSLVSGSDDHTVRIWDATTGSEKLALVGHHASINEVGFSPDGSRIVSCSYDEKIKLWDAKTGELIQTLPGSQGLTSISYDGSHVASGSLGDAITIWNVLTGDVVRVLKGPADRSNEAALSYNGSVLATYSFYAADVIKVLNVATGEEITTIQEDGRVTCVEFLPNGRLLTRGSSSDSHKIREARNGNVVNSFRGPSTSADVSMPTAIERSVVVGPDGMTVASASIDRLPTVWNIKTGTIVQTFRGHHGGFRGLAFNPDGSRIASGGDDSTIKIWDNRLGSQSRTLAGHKHYVNDVDFSSDGLLIASCSFDQTIKLWNARTGAEVRTLRGHSKSVNDISFSPDGLQLASAGEDELIKLWDVRTGEELSTVGPHPYSVSSVEYSPDGSLLASGATDHSVKLWDVRTSKEVRTLLGHQDVVACVEFSPNGELLASGSSDKTIKIWDAKTGDELRTFAGKQYGICLAFTNDSRYLVSGGSFDPNIQFWDLSTGANVRTLRISGAQSIDALAFSSDGTRLMCLSEGSIKILDPETGDELLSEECGHRKRVIGFALSPNSRFLATASWDMTINLRTIPSEFEESFIQRQPDMHTVAISHDGTRLATASYESLLIVWDAGRGEPISTIKNAPFGDGKNSLAFSRDGKALCIGSADKSIHMLNCDTGQEIKAFSGHRDPVQCVAFSSDGKRLVSGSKDFTIKLWDVQTGKDLRTFSGHQLAVKSVAFSQDGRLIYSIDDFSDQRVWDVENGNSLPVSEWQNWTDANRVSADGRWLVTSHGGLVDLEFKNRIDEKAYRAFKSRLDTDWHLRQSQMAESAQDFFASAFHRAWILKSEPGDAESRDFFRDSYYKWKTKLAEQHSSLDSSPFVPSIVREILESP